MSLIKNALAYSGTNIIAQGAMFIQAFILRALLVPGVMGLWNLVGVVRGYVAPISVGVILGAFRELPILKGQGKTAEEASCRTVAFTASLAEAGILALGITGYGLWRGGPQVWLFLTAGLLVIASRLQEAYITFFQGAQLYVPLSRILLINGLIYAVALPVGTLAAGLPGLLIAALIAEMLKGLWMVYSGKIRGVSAGWGFDKAVFKGLLSFGLGYRVADYPMTLFLMLNLLWVTWFMDPASLALYATANGLFLQAIDITARFGTVFYTRILEDYGKGISKERIGENFRVFIQIALLVAFPLVCWAVVSAFPILVRQVIPLYDGCIPVLLILMIGGFFIPINHHLFTIWIAEKRLIPYGISNFFGLMTVGLALIFLWYVLGGRQLYQVAQAAVLGYAIHFSYMMFGLGKELFGLWGALKIYGQVIIASIWTALVILYSGQWVTMQLTFSQDLVFSLKTTSWTLIALLPLIIYGLWVSDGYRLLSRQWRMAQG